MEVNVAKHPAIPLLSCTSAHFVYAVLSFLLPLLISFTLFSLFSYLYLTYRMRFLGIWTAAWALWSLRVGYVAFLEPMQRYTAADSFAVILGVSYITLILLGAAELGSRQVMKVGLPLAVFGVSFNAFFSSTGPVLLF